MITFIHTSKFKVIFLFKEVSDEYLHKLLFPNFLDSLLLDKFTTCDNIVVVVMFLSILLRVQKSGTKHTDRENAHSV